jgi:hypothetical protein
MAKETRTGKAKRISTGVPTLVTAITAVLTAVVAAGAFFISGEVNSPSPTVTVTISASPHITVSASPTKSGPVAHGDEIYSGTLSISSSVGLNLDTIPPTVGASSRLTLNVFVKSSLSTFETTIPLVLAKSESPQAPTFDECLTLINLTPDSTVNLGRGGWLCARTANGETAAIGIEAIGSSIAVMRITIWQP